MKGVILAGGRGSRLHLLTRVTNKHLLPVYDRPMICYPVQCMALAGITEVLLVAGGNNAGDFIRLLGNGRDYGLRELSYIYQPEAGGIAQALSLAEHFAAGSPLMLILGDNILERSLAGARQRYEAQGGGARILLSQVQNPSAYGVAELDEHGRVMRIHEKPAQPPGNWAVTGIYFYDHQVFDLIRSLVPSARNELEITDVNNAYLARGQLMAEKINGYWADAGENIDFYLRACNLVAQRGANLDSSQ